MTSSRKLRCPFDMSEVDSHTSGSEASLMAGWSLDPLGEQQAIAMMAAGSELATIHRKKGMAVDRVENTPFIFLIVILIFLITIR